MSLKFVRNGPIDYNPELVLHNSLAAGRQQYNLLSEPMMA